MIDIPTRSIQPRRDKLLLSGSRLVSGNAQQEIVNHPTAREVFSDFSQHLFHIFYHNEDSVNIRTSIFYLDEISRIIF